MTYALFQVKKENAEGDFDYLKLLFMKYFLLHFKGQLHKFHNLLLMVLNWGLNAFELY